MLIDIQYLIFKVRHLVCCNIFSARHPVSSNMFNVVRHSVSTDIQLDIQYILIFN